MTISETLLTLYFFSGFIILIMYSVVTSAIDIWRGEAKYRDDDDLWIVVFLPIALPMALVYGVWWVFIKLIKWAFYSVF